MEIALLTAAAHQKLAGERLRHVIDLLGIPYVEAASIMGVSKHVLRNWMAGDNYPQPYPLYRLAKAKGVNFDYVFLGDWQGLPHRIAKVLESEFEATPGGLSAETHADAASSSPTAPSSRTRRRRGDGNRDAAGRVRTVQ
jgi:transcriptional regulator with XRE-family HTH domain